MDDTKIIRIRYYRVCVRSAGPSSSPPTVLFCNADGGVPTISDVHPTLFNNITEANIFLGECREHLPQSILDFFIEKYCNVEGWVEGFTMIDVDDQIEELTTI